MVIRIKSDGAGASAMEPTAELGAECSQRRAGTEASTPCEGTTPTAPATVATDLDAAEEGCSRRRSAERFPVSRAVSDAVEHARFRKAWLAAQEEEAAAAAMTAPAHLPEKAGVAANLRRWMAEVLRAAARVLGAADERPSA